MFIRVRSKHGGNSLIVNTKDIKEISLEKFNYDGETIEYIFNVYTDNIYYLPRVSIDIPEYLKVYKDYELAEIITVLATYALNKPECGIAIEQEVKKLITYKGIVTSILGSIGMEKEAQ